MANGNVSKSIAKSIDTQEQNLLRDGDTGTQSFNTIRQRHIWSTYHFVNNSGGAIVSNIAGQLNVPQVQAGKYRLFKGKSGDNAQGLPQGFVLTDTDTNFSGGGRMPDQQNFSVWEIGVAILPSRQDVVADSPATRGAGPISPDDMDRILSDAVLSVQYLTEDVPLGHLHDFAEAGGPAVVVPSLLDWTGAAGVVAGPPQAITGGEDEGSIAGQPWALDVPRLAQNSGNQLAAPAIRRKLDIPIFLQATQQFQFTLEFSRNTLLRSLENTGTAGFAARVDLWVVESYAPVT